MNKIKLSRHAEDEMNRRGIPKEIVEQVLRDPEQVLTDQNGNDIYQSRIDFGTEGTYLVRVVAAEKDGQLLVITVYRSSKIGKYWRQS